MSIHPTKKTYEDFLKSYNADSEDNKRILWKQAQFAEKELIRKRKQYHKKREVYLATTPEDQRPKVGRPRKVNPHEVKLQEEKQSLQSELEMLRKELADLKEKASVPEPPPAPAPAPSSYTTPVNKNPYGNVISNSKLIKSTSSRTAL